MFISFLATTRADSYPPRPQSALAAGKVADRADNARGEYQTQVEAAKLARAAEEILRLTAEVQLALIVQDIGESCEEEKAAKAALETDARQAREELARLRDSVAGTLTELETHYYRSVPHVRVHEARTVAATRDPTPMQQ